MVLVWLKLGCSLILFCNFDGDVRTYLLFVCMDNGDFLVCWFVGLLVSNRRRFRRVCGTVK